MCKKNTLREETCFKHPSGSSCIDLSLKTSSQSFQKIISAGLSDFHKMIIMILTPSLNKLRAREIYYRDY